MILIDVIRKRRLSLLVEWLAWHLPGPKHIESGPGEDGSTIRIPRHVLWTIRYADARSAVFPRRYYVPWQPLDTDGPYLVWAWRGHDLFRRPWREGRTKERYEAARARAEELR